MVQNFPCGPELEAFTAFHDLISHVTNGELVDYLSVNPRREIVRHAERDDPLHNLDPLGPRAGQQGRAGPDREDQDSQHGSDRAAAVAGVAEDPRQEVRDDRRVAGKRTAKNLGREPLDHVEDGGLEAVAEEDVLGPGQPAPGVSLERARKSSGSLNFLKQSTSTPR